MTRRLITVGIALGVLISSVSIAAPCTDQLLDDLYVEGIDRCILFLIRSLPDNQDFADKLIRQAADQNTGDNEAPGRPLNYVQLAELAALTGTRESLDASLDLVPADDETRSIAVARLYELQAPLVLERMGMESEADQLSIAVAIAWGIANKHYPFINTDNYSRLAVGAHWEVNDPKHPHYQTAKRINYQLLSILEADRK